MQTIDISNDDGSTFGYVVGINEEQVQNWFLKHKLDPKQFTKVCQANHVAFLDTMHVNEDSRNEGNGSFFLSEFITEANLAGAGMIVLMCDKAEAQNEGFDLQKWYEDWEFEVASFIDAPEEFPIMIREI